MPQEYTPPPVTMEELTWRLSRLARQPGAKQLFCAADVAAALAAEVPPAGPPPPAWDMRAGDGQAIARLLAVDIVVTPDAAPGALRLVRHWDPETRRSTCEVRGTTVSHYRCAVVLEGTLTAGGQPGLPRAALDLRPEWGGNELERYSARIAAAGPEFAAALAEAAGDPPPVTLAEAAPETGPGS